MTKSKRQFLNLRQKSLRYILLTSTFGWLIASALIMRLFRSTLTGIQELMPTLSNMEVGLKLEHDFTIGSVIVLLVMAICTIASFVISVRLFNQISGPAVRFEKKLEDMLQNRKSEPIVLRKGDQFDRIAELMNQLAKRDNL